MFKPDKKRVAKLMIVPVLVAALLAGCGGDASGGGASNDGGAGAGSGGGGALAGNPPASMEQTIASVVQYINGLITGNGENTDPIDINPLTLATDDTAEAEALP